MYFIRHGQSHFNLLHRKLGRDPQTPDAALTEEGFVQARHAGEYLTGKGIKLIVSSPYTRALQTASTITSILNVPIEIEPLAGERSLFSCDIGTSVSQLRQDWAHLDFAHMKDEKWWPEDESHTDLDQRVCAFKNKWKDRLKESDVALVSHWYFLNHLTGHDFQNGQVVFKKLF